MEVSRRTPPACDASGSLGSRNATRVLAPADQLPTTPHRPTSRTEITPVLPDHRQIPALAAQFPCGRLRGSAADRGLQDSHLLPRQVAFVEDPQHRVAVDDQLREVGDGRSVVGLAARAGDEGHGSTGRTGQRPIPARAFRTCCVVVGKRKDPVKCAPVAVKLRDGRGKL